MAHWLLSTELSKANPCLQKKRDVSIDGRGGDCYGLNVYPPQSTELPKVNAFKFSSLNSYAHGVSEAETLGGD